MTQLHIYFQILKDGKGIQGAELKHNQTGGGLVPYHMPIHVLIIQVVQVTVLMKKALLLHMK